MDQADDQRRVTFNIIIISFLLGFMFIWSPPMLIWSPILSVKHERYSTMSTIRYTYWEFVHCDRMPFHLNVFNGLQIGFKYRLKRPNGESCFMKEYNLQNVVKLWWLHHRVNREQTKLQVLQHHTVKATQLYLKSYNYKSLGCVCVQVWPGRDVTNYTSFPWHICGTLCSESACVIRTTVATLPIWSESQIMVVKYRSRRIIHAGH